MVTTMMSSRVLELWRSRSKPNSMEANVIFPMVSMPETTLARSVEPALRMPWRSVASPAAGDRSPPGGPEPVELGAEVGVHHGEGLDPLDLDAGLAEGGLEGLLVEAGGVEEVVPHEASRAVAAIVPGVVSQSVLGQPLREEYLEHRP